MHRGSASQDLPLPFTLDHRQEHRNSDTAGSRTELNFRSAVTLEFAVKLIVTCLLESLLPGMQVC